MDRLGLPGSRGEHLLQQRQGSQAQARDFYRRHVLDHLSPHMQQIIHDQDMVFLATADGRGECDGALRGGPTGFVRVLDERTLVLPEYRGNGVYASLGNILENPHLGMVFLDFASRTSLHINGSARVCNYKELLLAHDLPLDFDKDAEVVGEHRPELWIEVEVEEAYLDATPHLPALYLLPRKLARSLPDTAAKPNGDHSGPALTVPTGPAG